MKYQIEAPMLGSGATEEECERLVEKLVEMGYDVEMAENCGLINTEYEPLGDQPNPIPDEVFFTALAEIKNK